MTHTIGPTPVRKKLTPARTPAGTQIVSTITTAAARLDHARRLKADGSVLTKLSVRAPYGGGTPHVAAEFRTRRSPSVRAPALPAQSCPGGRQGEIEPSGSIRPSEGGRSPPSEDSAHVERLAQAVADEVDGEHGQREKEAGEEDDPERQLHVRLALGHDVAPRRDVGRRAGAEERQVGL